MNRQHTYKFFVNKEKRKVIAISTYAGKTVRGIAICSEADEFDLEKGKQLAAARCNLKIANKRLDRAGRKYAEMEKKLHQVEEEYYRMESYQRDSSQALYDALINLNTILKELKK